MNAANKYRLQRELQVEPDVRHRLRGSGTIFFFFLGGGAKLLICLVIAKI